ncbi:MAG: zinc ribbon domain-containing protein [Clostridiales bacterium]|jgi:hypothetical protein|nr:zinc ribbon domain-containing protein [Clostridiales bacterium]
MEEKICKICDMLLTKDDEIGTNKDGSKNNDYCIHCYRGGKYLSDLPLLLEQSIAKSAKENTAEYISVIKQFVECWQAYPLNALQEIAGKYNVAFHNTDTKDILIKKLTDGMNAYCKNEVISAKK